MSVTRIVTGPLPDRSPSVGKKPLQILLTLDRQEEVLTACGDKAADSLQLRLCRATCCHRKSDIGTGRVADGGYGTVTRAAWHIHKTQTEIRLFGWRGKRVLLPADTFIGVAEIGVIDLALLAFGNIACGNGVDGVDRPDSADHGD